MFTGIIEQLGVVKSIQKESDNIHFTLEAPFTSELKIDQSVARTMVVVLLWLKFLETNTL